MNRIDVSVTEVGAIVSVREDVAEQGTLDGSHELSEEGLRSVGQGALEGVGRVKTFRDVGGWAGACAGICVEGEPGGPLWRAHGQ